MPNKNIFQSWLTLQLKILHKRCSRGRFEHHRSAAKVHQGRRWNRPLGEAILQKQPCHTVALVATVVLILILVFCAGCTKVENGLTPDELNDENTESADSGQVDDLSGPENGEQIGPGETDENQLSDGNVEDDQQSPAGDSGAYDQSHLLVISDGNYLLALTIKETTLKSDYMPADLQPIPDYTNPSYNMQLRAEALEYLGALWNAADADGVTLHIRSAYRSYATQEGLFRDYASRHGEVEANRFSARAGQSEHQLGTAVDFGGSGVDFMAEFAQTPQGYWLGENAHHFGFAMSYTEGNEEVTGYIFEPWHFRYIGIDEATRWKDSGKTLKEYLETKPQYYE